MGETGPVVDGDEPFWGANEKFVPLVVTVFAVFAVFAAFAVYAVLLTSGFSNAGLGDEEIGGRTPLGIEEAGVEDEKLEGRGVAGAEARGDGVGGTFVVGADPRVERGAEDEPLPCCCQSGVCEPDCDVPLL